MLSQFLGFYHVQNNQKNGYRILKYSSIISFERQSVIFPCFHRSMTFRGFPKKKDETKILRIILNIMKKS
ncbi:MAG: hypothetical protein A2161_06800 [Candidatus Schekmanbacteria bacterium RBG_13_48_7]|uniref:Uncharacterized protein n=1 Tax=Candidatus Schekmanbacteria bacterium RBG_13_48_7 TaxID=1817878 RepID=A0A1F7RKY9_9BACT|nr:MAG: hypothetical protein A2161_06800 [Candidatus Schekmanbacteria bacterium RBG_13_48_7]